MSYQKNIYVGNVGNDPTMKYTPAGQAVTNFSLAVNDEYTNAAGEKVKKTTWFRIETWGKTAEICNQYVKKGASILVEGKLKADENGNPRQYQKADKSWTSNFELTAQVVRFLSKRESQSMTESAHELGGQELPPEDDIPF